MPSKSDKPASTAEPRRSSRLSAAPPSKVESKDEGKKRTADKPDSKAPAAKKAKPDSKPPTSKPASKPASKSKPASTTTRKAPPTSKAKNADTIPEGDEAKADLSPEKEKEAEAPADAPTDKPASSSSKGGKINEGDVLPKDIKLKDHEGNEVDIGELAKDKGAVIFLYPRANTPGCTTQACGFRDAYDEIQKLGYNVYGLSSDNPTPQKNWKSKHNMQYTLLCDPDFKLIKRLGAFQAPKQTKRSSFIFEKGGKLVKANLGVKPVDDPKNCLQFIKSHK